MADTKYLKYLLYHSACFSTGRSDIPHFDCVPGESYLYDSLVIEDTTSSEYNLNVFTEYINENFFCIVVPSYEETLHISSPIPGEYFTNQPITYAALATSNDPEKNGPWSYTWSFDDNTSESGAAIASKTWSTDGPHVATITATNLTSGSFLVGTVEITTQYENTDPLFLSYLAPIIEVYNGEGVMTNQYIHNLAIAHLSNYPSEPEYYTFEIQRRDLLDRTNHTFTTYARLDSILASGDRPNNYSWIYVIDNQLYLSLTCSWLISPKSPLKTSLYRLDSVDSITHQGSLTLLETNTISNVRETLNFYFINSYGTEAFNYTYGYYGGTLTNDSTGTYHDYYGDHALIPAISHTGMTEWCTPYYWTGDLFHGNLNNQFILRVDETCITRVHRYISYIGDPDVNPVVSPTGSEYITTNLPGCNATGREPAGQGEIGTISMDGILPCLSGGLNGNGNIDSATYITHPISYKAVNKYALTTGYLTEYNNGVAAAFPAYYLDNTMNVVQYVQNPYLNFYYPYSGGWRCVGIWPDATTGEPIAYMLSRDPTSYGGYNYFNVFAVSDTSFTTPYSPYACLWSDNSIYHLEGVETPTPVLMSNNTVIRNVN